MNFPLFLMWECHAESEQAAKVVSDAELGKSVFGDCSEKGAEKVMEDKPFPREGMAAGFIFLSKPLNRFAAKRKIIHIMWKHNYIHMNTHTQTHTVPF